MAYLKSSRISTMELFCFQPLTIFTKNPIVTVPLGSEYACVTINLISTTTTKLHSKTTKINEIFIGTSHFFLKLVQKLKIKVFIFRRSSLTAHKDKFMSNESPTRTFWLLPNVTNAQKRVPKYPQPWSRDSEVISPYML